MKLKDYIMVVCRNAGRYYKVANRSGFYHDFLRSLYDTESFPAIYDNRVACLNAFIEKFGFLPRLDIHDENKDEHYIYYFDESQNSISSITIREVIMEMYNEDVQYEYSMKSLLYSKMMFSKYGDYIEKSEIVTILMELASIDFSKYNGNELICEIEDEQLSKIINESKCCKAMFGIDKPQDKIAQKRTRKLEIHND